MRALGVHFAKGFLTNFPSRAILSPPALTCLPSSTKLVQSFDSSVPSNVSTSASSIKNVLNIKFVIVELSLSVSSADDIAATGPDVNAMTAAWGR